MLDPVALRAALRQKGWKAEVIAGLFVSVGLAMPAEPGEAGEDPTPVRD